MKNFLIIAALVVTGFTNAQKGTLLVAGNVDFYSQKQANWKSNSFSFSPKVGYQFTENLTAGVESTIGNSKVTTTTTSLLGTSITADVEKDDLKLGGFLRYAKSLGGAFAAYADLGAGMQSSKEGNVKSNGFYVGITPAVFIDLKNSFGLNFSVGGLSYDSIKSDTAGATAINTFNFNFGKNLSIGLSKNF